jgi:hypothetical protein
MELFYKDYKIVSYEEHRLPMNPNSENIIYQINIKLEIINKNKLDILENSIKPIIYINMNNKKYIAKGHLSVLSSFPIECDFSFPIDSNGKIEFFEKEVIDFLGFENR